MILPERVFSNFSTNSTCSGLVIGPTSRPTCWMSSEASSGLASQPDFRITKLWITLPRTSWGMPMAAASATAGWLTRADSISAVPSR